MDGLYRRCTVRPPLNIRISMESARWCGSEATVSAPASPQQQSTPVPMDVQVTPAASASMELSSPAESTTSAGSSSSAASSTTSAADVPMETSASSSSSSTPGYTPAEQKMLATIQSVSDKIDALARELPTLKGQIANHTARLALYKWHPTNLTLDAEKLNRSHKTLHYHAGMVDENTLQQIFRLDSIQTENDSIRAARKAAVKKGNEVIKAAVVFRFTVRRIEDTVLDT